MTITNGSAKYIVSRQVGRAGSARRGGMHVIYDHGPEAYARWRDAGATIILHMADILAVRFMLRREINSIRKVMTLTTPSVPEPSN